MSETKALSFKIDGLYIIISLDPNKDGTPVAELKVLLTEVPDEIMSAISK